jgi:hypothetical protein
MQQPIPVQGCLAREGAVERLVRVETPILPQRVDSKRCTDDKYENQNEKG